MIDRYLLRYFVAVIDHGNFTRAAQRCRVSQPTLSVGIAKLEAILERKLFLRTNRRVELTAAGTRFALHARKIEAEFALAEHALDEDKPSAILRVGIISTLPLAWIEHALAVVHNAKTGSRIEIVEGRSRDLSPMLDRDRVDAILGTISVDQTSQMMLFREGYAVAMASDHPLAERESVSAGDLGNEPMIVRRHCEALSEISRFFTSRGIRPFLAARTTNDERAVAFVRSGLGITVMPACFGGPGIAMVRLVGFTTTRAIGFQFGFNGATRLSENLAFQSFANAIRASADPLKSSTSGDP